MGTGTGGHLWPAGPAAASLDPINVQAGASGVGLFLAQLSGRPTPARPARRADEARLRGARPTAGWVSDRSPAAPTVRPASTSACPASSGS